ncbi:ABC transporter ATP-binding protein [Pseudomonas sp. PB120]|uniref:ABC transporter ATP-binding protein n=1 Tax=Pseudomonas sp. PB120 TaxID=2494700 RepID=UPI0012FD7B3D|nr:ABC transporter ATP-binding protein [Pseudomonas sp. PB120]MVV47549.1 ABC transporter ATP-binding protein [Pseudomonas sp. PB120]
MVKPIEAPLLEVRHLHKRFDKPRGLIDVLSGAPARSLHAVRDVSFSIAAGETLGVVGESGCGKSTLGRCLVGLHPPSAGDILWRGRPISELGNAFAISRKIQMIFQDPYSSLNPRMTLAQTLGETLKVHGIGANKAERDERIDELLLTVGLPPRLKDRLPHAFSGGQRQRISIARALAVGPELIVADEPVSALDASVQAQIINLFEEIRENMGVAFLFIAHDLNVVRHISQRIGVMYLGQMMEVAPADTLFDSPLHPYSRALLSAIPLPDPEQRNLAPSLEGELPDPHNPPPGCAFSSRCPRVSRACQEAIPALVQSSSEHAVRCVHPYEPTLSSPDLETSHHVL